MAANRIIHQIKYAGRYQIKKYTRGILVYESPWFDNLITDAGLDAMGTGFGVRCYAGDGTAAPAHSDTGLSGTVLGSVTSSIYSVGPVLTAEPYYVEYANSFPFAFGSVVGAVSEVAIGNGTPTPTFLFSRSLARDEFGAVTSVVFTASDQLVVNYSARVYVPTEDVTSTVLVNGVYHDALTRAADLGRSPTVDSWTLSLGSAISTVPAGVFSCLTLYAGGIAASVLDVPLSPIAYTSEIIQAAYTPGSLTRTAKAIFIPSSGSGDVRSLKSVFKNGGVFQTEIDPPITKTNRQTVEIDFTCSWQHYGE